VSVLGVAAPARRRLRRGVGVPVPVPREGDLRGPPSAAEEPRPREAEVDGEGAGVPDKPPVSIGSGGGGDCGAGAEGLAALAFERRRRIAGSWRGRKWNRGWKGAKEGGFLRKEAAEFGRSVFNSRAKEGGAVRSPMAAAPAVASWERGSRGQGTLLVGYGFGATVDVAWLVCDLRPCT
jgi:hypothetical protein